MADIVIIDPEELTDHERDRIADLAEMNEDRFTGVVGQFLEHPDDSTRQVLFSAELAQDTFNALSRLHAYAVAAEARAQPHSEDRQRAVARTRLIAAMRDDLRTYVNLAVQAAASNGPRRRAERVLGKVRYGELRQIMRDIGGGMTDSEAEAAARARGAGNAKATPT